MSLRCCHVSGRVRQKVEKHLLHLALVGANHSEVLVDRASKFDAAPLARSRTKVSVFSMVLGRSKKSGCNGRHERLERVECDGG